MANNDDFDDFDSGEGFDDFDSGETLGDTLRNNPLIKVGLVVVTIVVVVGGIFVFSGGGSKQSPEDSKVASGVDINPDLANPNVTPTEQYQSISRVYNEQEANRALQSGQSAVNPPVYEEPDFEDPLAALEQEIKAPQEDPLDIFRRKAAEEEIQREIERQQQQIQQQQQEFVQQQQDFQQEVEQVFSIQPDPASVQQLSQAMLEQMNSILGGVTIGPVNSITVTNTQPEGELAQGQLGPNGTPLGGNAGQQFGSVEDVIEESTDTQEVFIEAGTFNYAQILNEATTDAPTPVLAVLLSGPLKGGRLIGQFQQAPTQQSLIIRFNTIVKDGTAYSANSFAVDPNTSSPAVVTEYDRRLFRRVLLPAAAEFIQGIAGAYAQEAQTEVVIGTDTVTTQTSDLDVEQEIARGVEQGADELSQFLRQEGQQFPPLVRVAPGTPIGVIYIDNVVESNAGTVAGASVNRQTLPPSASQAVGGLPALPPVDNTDPLSPLQQIQ